MLARLLRLLKPTPDRLLIAAFFVAIFLPVIGLVWKLDPTPPPIEKRELTPLPLLASYASAPQRFPAQFDAYYADHFGFRSWLIRAHTRVRVQWLGVSLSPQVVLGTNGYLFYTGDRELDYYRGVEPFTEEELARCRRVLEERQAWLTARGAHLLVIVAPNKETIYPEYMPTRLRPVRSESRLDQFLAYFGTRSTVPVLDLRPALRQGKKQHPVYTPTDTHWDEFGAFIASQAVIDHLLAWYPRLGDLPEPEYEVREQTVPGIDLAEMLGMEDVLTDRRYEVVSSTPRLWQAVDPAPLLGLRDWGVTPPIVTERPGAGLPRAVVFCDSFINRLFPFLSDSFGRVAYLREYEFDLAALDHEKPDLVILELAERKLLRPTTFPDNSPRVRAARAGPGPP
jgi:alginate O-acetyltransferase complex protein AlgJ